MFPEETYLTRRCGRMCAGRAQLPVVAAEGRKFVRQDVYVGKNWVLRMVILYWTCHSSRVGGFSLSIRELCTNNDGDSSAGSLVI
jgi:hypothetical protein